MRTELNVLALGNYLLLKENQPPWPEGKGEGLESEDAAVTERSEQPEPLLAALRKLFRSEVVRLSAELRSSGQVAFALNRQRAPTRWRKYEDAMPLSERFEFSPAWDCADPDPEAFADALIRNWTIAGASGALRPLLVRLIKLGLAYPPTEALEEEVSEAVYVMF